MMQAAIPDALNALSAVDGCALWTFDLDAPRLRESLDALSDDERARAGRFVFERDRHRFAAGRAALRFLLGSVLDREPRALVFSLRPHGKPFLRDDPAVGFNLSHSGAMAIVAIDGAGREVGVDIELQREVPDAMDMARACFEAGEIDTLAGCDAASRDEAFLLGWTRKEACLKAIGTGFSGASIPSTGIDASPRLVSLQDGTFASLTSLRLPNADANAIAIAALAVVGGEGPLNAPTARQQTP